MKKKLLLCVAVGLMTAAAALAQAVAGMGGLTGTVRDASGAAVPGAQVVVANESKGIKRSLQSNDAGVFTAPALVPSRGFSISVNKGGFAPWEAKDIEILVGQNLNYNVVLSVAATSTQLDVSATAQLVETTKTGVSQVVNSEQILNLPINGRRVDSFVLLTPAVVADGAFGLVSFRGIAGGNAFLTDGNDTTQQFYNEAAGRTRISSQISQDAVQEFQVLSNGYSAEFGRASGGVINTVTRSGGNGVHGTGYWFFRNQDFNATDRYAGGLNPEEKRNQFGGSVSGPIKKDKLFYFFNVEATRRNFPLINKIINVNFYDNGGAGNWIGKCAAPATEAQCAAAKTVFDRQFQTVPREANSELGFGKLDYRPTERNSFSASFNYMRWLSPNGIQTQAVLTNGNGVGGNANSTVRTRYARLSWTAIPTNTMVNEVRFGWFKDRLFDDISPTLAPPFGRTTLTVGGQSNLGIAQGYPRLLPSEQRFQIADNLTWTIGKHTVKIGGDISNTQDYVDQLYNRYGTYSYSTLTDFAQDFSANPLGGKHWNSFSQAFGNPVLDLTTRDFSAYIQDQFRATSKLTLNFGVRYEYSQLPQPAIFNQDYPQTGQIKSPAWNYAPRFSLSYALGDKTVIRGGYGIFYARFQGALLDTLLLTNGVYQSTGSLQGTVAADLANGPVFPNVLPNAAAMRPGSVDLEYAAKGFRNPYTQQADLAIERQLSHNVGLTVSYIFSRANSLYTTRSMNVAEPTDSVTYPILDFAGAQVGSYTTPFYRLAARYDSRYRNIYQLENGGKSWYNGLVVQVRKRMSHGLEGSVAYTWSHAIDTANQGGGSDATFFSYLNSTSNGSYAQDKGSSSLDQRHRLTITSLWSPTLSKSNSAFAKYVINNWQLSQITTLASAQPTTATIRISTSPSGAYNTSTINGFGGSSRVPWLPLNSVNIDQVYRVDARITKLIPIREKMSLSLNFEAFNVFNTIYNTGVNTEAYSLVSGALKPTIGLGWGRASQGNPDGTNARRAQFSMRFTF